MSSRKALQLFVGGEDGFLLSDGLSESCPSGRTVINWQLKLDMGMMYDRHFYETFDGHMDLHLSADSSPIGGRNILCAREESFTTSRQQLLYGPVVGNFSFESRRLPPSYLALGHAAVADVSHRICNSMVLVSGSAVDMYRGCVRTWLGDQSKESHFGDVATDVLCHVCPEHQFSSAMPGDAEFLLPDCMTVYDHLHIFQNSLQTAIESL